MQNMIKSKNCKRKNKNSQIIHNSLWEIYSFEHFLTFNIKKDLISFFSYNSNHLQNSLIKLPLNSQNKTNKHFAQYYLTPKQQRTSAHTTKTLFISPLSHYPTITQPPFYLSHIHQTNIFIQVLRTKSSNKLKNNKKLRLIFVQSLSFIFLLGFIQKISCSFYYNVGT